MPNPYIYNTHKNIVLEYLHEYMQITEEEFLAKDEFEQSMICLKAVKYHSNKSHEKVLKYAEENPDKEFEFDGMYFGGEQ